MVEERVDSDCEDGGEDECCGKSDEGEWPGTVSLTKPLWVITLPSKEVREKIEAWREKEGRNSNAVKDTEGDQGPKQGGGKERRSMLDSSQWSSSVTTRRMTLLSKILWIMTMLHSTTKVSTALEKVWVW